MPTLLVAEHDNNTLKDATAKALSAAAAIGAEVHVLVAGKDCDAAAAAASKLKGVAKVLKADAPPFEHMLAEPMAALIVALAPAYDAIVAPATANGKNFMPRVAALLDVMQISDIVKVIAPDTFERLIYAGNAVQTVRSQGQEESDHGAHLDLSRQPGRAARPQSNPSLRPPTRASRPSRARNCRGPIGRN